jgi:hypothetical protein
MKTLISPQVASLTLVCPKVPCSVMVLASAAFKQWRIPQGDYGKVIILCLSYTKYLLQCILCNKCA